MRPWHLIGALMMGASACAGVPASAQTTASASADAATTDLLEYLRSQNSTGLLIVQDGRTVLEKSWAPPEGDRQFQLFVYGKTADGALLEDVASQQKSFVAMLLASAMTLRSSAIASSIASSIASQQKSFVAMLLAIALDRKVIALDRPVSQYLGAGWSKATPAQEAAIRVDDVLHMNSGLDDKFAYVAPPGTTFFYNTPVYAVTKRLLEAAAGKPLDAITREWLTGPAGMADSGWRKRPGALASVGNDTGLVTTPRDTALFGRIVLGQGIAANGKRIVSAAHLRRLFEPSPTNPAYGRLWWLNGGAYAVRAGGRRIDGPLIAAAPRDLVAALGAFDRRLFVVPSRKLIVVRTGAAAVDKDFDEQFWRRLRRLLG